MSNINKKTLLVAAMTAVLVPGMAFAAKVTVNGGTASKFAYEVTNLATGSNPTADLNYTFDYALEGGDLLVGRSTGNITVRVILTGAEFASLPTVVVPANQGTAVGTATFSGNTLSFVMTPITSGMIVGSLFTITAPSLKTNKATALNSLDGNIVAGVDVRDTTGGNTLQSTANGTVYTAKQASSITFGAAASTTVDVVGGKKKFTTGGGYVDANNVTLGTLTAKQNVAAPTIQALGAGATFTDNIDAGTGEFQFDVTGAASVTASLRDRLYTEVNFTDTTGFAQVYLSTAACATGTTTVVDSAGVTAVLTKTGNQFAGELDLGVDGDNPVNICGRVNGTGIVKNQDITAAAKLNFLTARDTALSTATTIQTLKYNGASKQVYHVNPGSNTNQVSYLRISNTSTTTGNVSITGTCDNGVAGTQAAVFSLTAGNSVQLTSKQIEEGGAGGITAGQGIGRPGTCTGKWRMDVTGEFGTMELQNFLKNYTGSGEVNTNVNDKD